MPFEMHVPKRALTSKHALRSKGFQKFKNIFDTGDKAGLLMLGMAQLTPSVRAAKLYITW